MSKRSKEYLLYLNSNNWKEKREELFKVRGKSCERCKKDLKNKSADVHHVTYENFGNEKLEDLEVLCRSCHSKHHNRKPKKKTIKKEK